ncbi:MAG: phosphoribosylformimino-5-aminoimidazole carboxamide ribotide isomerase, partial [Cellvibrionaceae bacterium]
MLTNKHHFTIFPAVHIRSGKVVRFKGGDSSNSIVFSSDPVACAQNWIDQGATWLQLVNLDAVFDEGTANNWELIKKICQLNVNIQLAGGIRTMEDVDWALNSGINRVIIGSAAVDNPQFMADAIAKYGADKVIVAIDSDESGKVRTHGWRGVSAIESIGFGVQMRQLGVTTAVYTNIHRDGSMTGVDWQSAADLSKFTGLQIIAGGG